MIIEEKPHDDFDFVYVLNAVRPIFKLQNTSKMQFLDWILAYHQNHIQQYDNIDDFVDIAYEYCITNKNRKDFYYDVYLKSNHWRNFRNYLHLETKKCELCGILTTLNVHHNNYQCLFKETEDDVHILCSCCHIKLHKLFDERQRLIVEDLNKINEIKERKDAMITYFKNAVENKCKYDISVLYATSILPKIIPLIGEFLKGYPKITPSMLKFIKPQYDDKNHFALDYSAYTGQLRQYRISKGYKKQDNKKKTYNTKTHLCRVLDCYCSFFSKGAVYETETTINEVCKQKIKDTIRIVKKAVEKLQDYLLDFEDYTI